MATKVNKIKALNPRTATSQDMRNMLKAAGQYKPGMHKPEMVQAVAKVQAQGGCDLVDSPNPIQKHSVHRALLAYERKTGKEATRTVVDNEIRSKFSDFSDKGFEQALLLAGWSHLTKASVKS